MSKIIKKHPNGRYLRVWRDDKYEYAFHATKGLRKRRLYDTTRTKV